MLLDKAILSATVLLATAVAAPAPRPAEGDVSANRFPESSHEKRSAPADRVVKLVDRVAEPQGGESPYAKPHGKPPHDARDALIDRVPAELVVRVAVPEPKGNESPPVRPPAQPPHGARDALVDRVAAPKPAAAPQTY